MGGICFVAHTSFRELADPGAGAAGGIQRQQSFMARWLAARGYRVSMITWDEGQLDGVIFDGVRGIKICRREAGWPVFRFFHPRWTSLIHALRRADADVYYHNSAEYVTGQVALWCRAAGRRFVYSVASDPACERELAVMPTRRERLLYRHGLQRADRVIAQTRHQQHLLQRNFGVESIVLPMPCPGPSAAEYTPPGAALADQTRVLWVGRIAEMKRPEMLLAAARALPRMAFDLVGAPDADTAYGRAVLADAEAHPNVTVHGRVDRDRLRRLYERASILVATSTYEGFPNTYLEAWSHGLPVVSTVDPDGVIEERRLGFVAHDISSLVAALERITGCAREWRLLSERCRQYYLDCHTPDRAMPAFERIFQQLIAAGPETVPSTSKSRA